MLSHQSARVYSLFRFSHKRVQGAALAFVSTLLQPHAGIMRLSSVLFDEKSRKQAEPY